MKKNKNFLLIIIIFILLIFLSDFIFLIIKKKPLILTNKTNQKYSSIFYDVYDCNNEKVIKNKFSKFNCQVTDTKKNNDNNDNVNNNTNKDDNTNKDNNIDNNKDNKDNTDTNKDNTNNNNNNNNKDTDNNNNNNNNTNKDNDNTIKDNTIKDNTIKDSIIGNKITIIDKSSGNCPQAIEYYYEDSEYKYYFTCVISGSIFVRVDGVEYNIKDALNNKIVTMNELIEAGFKPLKKSKNLSAY